MVEVVRSYINDGIGLIQIGAVLIVGFVVLAAWTKTRSVMGTVGAMVVGALVLGYIFNADWFGRKMAEDIVQRENGMPVLAGSVLPVSGDQAEALALLLVRTALTTLWVLGATLALALVVKLTGRRLDLGSPGRAVRRGVLRARWASVSRSSGLAISRDRRRGSALTTPSLTALLTAPLDKAPAPSGTPAKPQPVERLPRLSRGRASPDRLTVTYRLDPPRGSTVEDVADKAQALADGLHVERVVVRRVPGNRGELTVYLGDVFRVPRLWAPLVLAEPAVPWGVDENGATTVFPLGEGHALVAGTTGAGKSGLVNSFVGSAALRADVALLGVDLKRVELGPWRDRFSELAVEPAHAAALVAELADEVRRRYVLLDESGRKKMTAADQGIGPWIILVVDELSELLDTIDKGDLISIGRLARACGVCLFVATQRPTAKTLSADLRDQLDVMRWCGRVPANSTTGEMVLGDAVKTLDPAGIDRAVKAVGVLDDAAGVRLARPWWLDDETGHLQAVAASVAHLRVPIEDVFPARAATAVPA